MRRHDPLPLQQTLRSAAQQQTRQASCLRAPLGPKVYFTAIHTKTPSHLLVVCDVQKALAAAAAAAGSGVVTSPLIHNPCAAAGVDGVISIHIIPHRDGYLQVQESAQGGYLGKAHLQLLPVQTGDTGREVQAIQQIEQGTTTPAITTTKTRHTKPYCSTLVV